MTKLTIFQEQCGDELRALLTRLGHRIRSWNIVTGREETFVEVDAGPVRLWIYGDGACWQGLGRDRIFEAIDYDSLTDLQQAFLAEVTTALSRGSVEDQK